jgi:hypothetical protein
MSTMPGEPGETVTVDGATEAVKFAAVADTVKVAVATPLSAYPDAIAIALTVAEPGAVNVKGAV